MNISEVLKNTSYDTSMFSDSAIKAIEDNVFLKEVRGKDVPHITCLIRKKPIRLSPEEVVRQLYIHKLINEYHYPESRISLETPVHFGREVKRADITIVDKDRPDVPYIIVELKKPKLTDGKEQLKSYCNAMLTERLNKRQAEKEALEEQLAIEENKRVCLSEAQILAFLSYVCEMPLDDVNKRRAIINILVHSVYLYDDHFTLIINASKKPMRVDDIPLEEIEEAFNSDKTCTEQCSTMISPAPPLIIGSTLWCSL